MEGQAYSFFHRAVLITWKTKICFGAALHVLERGQIARSHSNGSLNKIWNLQFGEILISST